MKRFLFAAMLGILVVACLAAASADVATVGTGEAEPVGYATFAAAWADATDPAKYPQGADDRVTVRLFARVDRLNHFEEHEKPIIVPAGTYITLDLNGFAIDRGLANAIKNGNVITVYGDLTITDSGAAQGGSVTGGNNASAGGGVALDGAGAVFTMLGGQITGNKSEMSGGGVYFTEGEVNLGGAANITGNTAGGEANNLCIAENTSNDPYNGHVVNILTGDPLKDGASIGVTVQRSFAGGGDAHITNSYPAALGNMALYFHPDAAQGYEMAEIDVGWPDGTTNQVWMRPTSTIITLDLDGGALSEFPGASTMQIAAYYGQPMREGTRSIIVPELESHTFSGYYIENGSQQLIDATGQFAASVANYTNADRAWISTESAIGASAKWQKSVPDPEKLATPGNPRWDADVPGKAVWDAVEGAAKYAVDLRKGDGTMPCTTLESTETAVDFSDDIADEGKNDFVFYVRALAKSEAYENSDWSAHSPVYAYNPRETTKLPAPLNPRWDANTPGKAVWDAVENAQGYRARLYRDGVIVTQRDTAGTFADFMPDITSEGPGDYAFTVASLAKTGTQYEDSDASAAALVYTHEGPSQPAPLNARWDAAVPGRARWNAAEGASSYKLTLKMNGKTQLSVSVESDITSHDFIEDIKKSYAAMETKKQYSFNFVVNASTGSGGLEDTSPLYAYPEMLRCAISPQSSFVAGKASDIIVTVGAGTAIGAGDLYAVYIGDAAIKRGVDYLVGDGSVVVTLKKAYLDTLTPGEHPLRVVMKDDAFAEGVLTAYTPAPATGDASAPLAWLGALLLGLGAAAAVYGKRKKARIKGNR